MNTIYVVRQGTGEPRLVDAPNPAAAIQFVANPKYTATPVKARELANMMAAGVQIEKAKPNGAADNGFTEPTK